MAQQKIAPSFDDIMQTCQRDLESCQTAAELQQIQARYLGKQSLLSKQLRDLGKLPVDVRKTKGGELHQVKLALEQLLQAKKQGFEQQQQQLQLERLRCDVSAPGRLTQLGSLHPIAWLQTKLVDALSPLGFELAEGRLVETDWHNFTALNMPEDHPARAMQDTFFLPNGHVLRTHTSSVQIRCMQQSKPPIRMLSTGMVFRRDEVDATHSPAFHQLEGLWIDEQATLTDLKGVLLHLLHRLFGAVSVRFRPSFFPFTEPSIEADIACQLCAGKQANCRICKGTGWLEILGAGMVDPAVLTAVGYDPEQVQGFAFGVGIERLAMLLFGIEDIRLLYEHDVAWLQQFSSLSHAAPPFSSPPSA